ncbi:MAG: Gfo/Idh/MocA family protein [Gemmatimonadaceae bacterium]
MSTPRAARAVEKLGIGVVGAGFGRAVHVPAIRSDERCRVVAIAAASEESAERAATELGIERWSGNWRNIVDDPDVRAVTVALPPPLQVAVAGYAIKKGKHVFLEKPLATNATEAKALLSAAGKHQVVHAIDFEFPEIPAWSKARALLPSLGDLRNVIVQWHFETYAHRTKADSWKVKASEGGGTLNHFASHVFYNLEWLLGPIARLSARLGDSGGFSEVLVDLWLTFRSGVPGTVAMSANAVAGPGHTIQIFGERGMLTLFNPGPAYFDGFTLTLGTRESVSPIPVERIEKDRIDVVGRVMRRFVDAIVSGGSVEPNLTHGLRVQRLIDAARRSSKDRSWVKV